MALKGKYDFPGIKKAGTAGLSTVLAGTPFGAAMLANPIGAGLFKFVTGFIVEFLANKGLILVNIGIEVVDGKLDQKKFDVAMEKGIEAAKTKGLTDAEKKKIDDAVIDAFNDFADIGAARS